MTDYTHTMDLRLHKNVHTSVIFTTTELKSDVKVAKSHSQHILQQNTDFLMHAQ